MARQLHSNLEFTLYRIIIPLNDLIQYLTFWYNVRPLNQLSFQNTFIHQIKLENYILVRSLLVDKPGLLRCWYFSSPQTRHQSPCILLYCCWTAGCHIVFCSMMKLFSLVWTWGSSVSLVLSPSLAQPSLVPSRHGDELRLTRCCSHSA